VQSQERKNEKQVKIVSQRRVTVDLGTKRPKRPQEQIRIETLGGPQPPPNLPP
jgi:hypothetical protein